MKALILLVALFTTAAPAAAILARGHGTPASDEAEEGQAVLLVGRGDNGNPQDGVVGNDGRFRRATNLVARVRPGRIDIRMDAPGDGVGEMEGISGPGDSGTPLLGEQEGRLLVVGVGSVGGAP